MIETMRTWFRRRAVSKERDAMERTAQRQTVERMAVEVDKFHGQAVRFSKTVAGVQLTPEQRAALRAAATRTPAPARR